MEEKKQPRYSYTSLSTFENCPLSWAFKYQLGYYPQEDTLALSFGNLCHKVLELAVTPSFIANGGDPIQVFRDGWQGDGKLGLGKETILGLEEIKGKYFEDWIAPDAKTGRTYEACLPNFYNYVEQLCNADSKTILGSEVEFLIEVEGHLIQGSIDSVRLDENGKLRCIDFKSGRNSYDSKKLASPLQHYIYSLALAQLFPQYELGSCEYHHVIVPPPDNIQVIASRGWQTRCEKKLHKIFTELETAKQTRVFEPNPTPLCFWCPMCQNNPKAQPSFKDKCPYYSLWTRTNKTFQTNKEFAENTTIDDIVAQQQVNTFILDF